MGAWSTDSQTHVASMSGDDFFGSEQSHTMESAGSVRIEHVAEDGTVSILKDGLALQAGEVIDSSRMSCTALREFLAQEIADAKASDVLLSLHMKATMMKVSDPIIFGHAVSVYFADVLSRHAAVLEELGFEPNNGIGDLYARIESLDEAKKSEILADLDAVYASQPRLAMVNSRQGNHQSACAQ